MYKDKEIISKGKFRSRVNISKTKQITNQSIDTAEKTKCKYIEKGNTSIL